MCSSDLAWSPEQALKTVEDAIAKTNGNLAAILANNSGMARGAVQAVAAAKLEHVFIAGADADAANVEYVCEGKQSVEVLKAIRPLAERAAAVAVNLVEPGNARALVIDSGFQPAAALPACK